MRAKSVHWPVIEEAHLLPKRYVDVVHMANASEVGELCDVASGVYARGYSRSAARATVPYIRVNNVREFVPNITPSDLEYVEPEGRWGERVRLSVGDVVIARTGTLGRAFVAPRRLEGAVMSQHVTRLRLREPSSIAAHLLAAYLNSPQGKTQVNAVASGSTRLELTHNAIARLRIPQQIFLTRAVSDKDTEVMETAFDETIAGSLAALAACDGLAQSEIREERFFAVAHDTGSFADSLVPRYHSPSATQVETSLESRFHCVPLGEIALVKRGAGTRSSEYQVGDIPYIRTSSIVNHGLELFPEHTGTLDTYRIHNQHVGPGDILLTMEGRVGAVAFLGDGERCLIKNHVELVRMHQSAPVPAEFVYAFLSSRAGQVQIGRRTVVQATIPGLGSKSRQLLVPVGGRDESSERELAGVVATATAETQRATTARIRLRGKFQVLRGIAEEVSGDQSCGE